MKVAGRWRYVYRAVDQYGQIIDVLVSSRRDLRAARRFFAGALRVRGEPVEVVTDRARALRAAIEALIRDAFHYTEQYANSRVECDHGRLKARLRPMRGHTDRVIIRSHAVMQNIRRGHYELGVDARTHRRIDALVSSRRTCEQRAGSSPAHSAPTVNPSKWSPTGPRRYALSAAAGEE